MNPGAVIHIAGQVVHVNTLLRQRCGWCGAVLIDENLDNVMVMSDDPVRARVPTWEVGTFVAVDGAASWTVEHEDGAELPDGACARLDPEVTL